MKPTQKPTPTLAAVLGLVLLSSPLGAQTIGPGSGITDATDQDTPGGERLNVDTTTIVNLAAGTYDVTDWALNVKDHNQGGTITPMLLSGSPGSYTTLWVGAAFDPTSDGVQTVPESLSFTLGAATDVYAGFFTAGAGSGIIALDANNSGSGSSTTNHDGNGFTAPTGPGQTVDGFSHTLGRTYAFEINVTPAVGAPVVNGLSPADDATGVQTTSSLEVTFNKSIAIDVGNITLKDLDTPADTVIPVGDSQVSVAGTVLTINPTGGLAGLTNYAVVIDPGAIEDTFGNDFAGIANDGTWNFTTAAFDATAPTVLTLSPADDAMDVWTGVNLVATFDEDVVKGSGDIVIKRLSDDSVFDTVDVTTAAVTISAAEVTIDPSLSLEVGTGYYVEVAAGALEDPAGNPFGGISGNSAWNFASSANSIYYLAISSDADSGIDSSKTYTHALDFGTNGGKPVATINGVVFADGGTGAFPAIGGSSQTVGTGTSNIPNSHPGNGTADPFLADVGMENLVGDMIYNNTAAQIELTGLTPGQSYRFRLYHRPWSIGADRVQTIEFDTDGIAGAEHSGAFNEDDATDPDPGFATAAQVYSLNYDYTLAPGQTTLTVDIDFVAGGTYHLYGLTNEEVNSAIPPGVASLSPADDATDVPRITDLVITFDELIQKGSGNIEIYKADDTLVDTIDVNSAAATVSGLELTIVPTFVFDGSTGYYVQIAAGAVEDLTGNAYAGITDTTSWSFTTTIANDISFVQITGDADSGISASNTYTHTLDFGQGSPGALINSVQFDAYNNAANGTLNFNRTVGSGTTLDHAGNGGHNVTGGLVDLLTDMYFNNGIVAGGTTTWTLSGLTAGITYDTRIYTRQWGPSANRLATFVFDPDGAGPIGDPTAVISEDEATSVGMAADNDAYYINYRFTAVAGEDLVITVTQHNVNNSWHLYGLSNEVATTTTAYDTWAGGTFANPFNDTATGDNQDADSLINLLEFGFGTDPTVSDAVSLSWDGVNPAVAGVPALDVSFPGGGGVDFKARFMRRKDHGTAGSVSYSWEFSSDLSDWESSADTPGWFVAPTDLADDASGDYDLMEVPFPLFLDNGKKARFFRVTVTAL